MDKSSRTLTKWRDESGTPGASGGYQHKVTLYCTCLFLHWPRLRRKNRGKNQKELNFSASFTMPVPHAALLHFRRVPRRGPGCISFRLARRAGGGSGVCRPRTLAPPAGLWTRRAHEDRNRQGALSFGGASRQDDRLSDRGDARESRLAELERGAAGGDGRSRETQARGVAAPGPRRSCRSFEVRFHGSALCPGARLGPGIGGAGCDWRARETAVARVGRGSLESCDCGRRGFNRGSGNRVGADRATVAQERSAAGLRRRRCRAAHEGRSRKGSAPGGFGGGGFGGGGARGSARPWAP